MLRKIISRNIHAKYTIIGSGDAGKSMAKLLNKSKSTNPYDIRLIDPVTEYTYQSGLTLVGGGIKKINEIKKSKNFLLPLKSDHVNESVVKVNPENNELFTDEGNKFTYDHLIIASGIKPTPSRIKGLQEALDDEDCPVGTIYLPQYAIKYHNLVQNLTNSGKSNLKTIFTQPSTPIKCGGAPQKILHLTYENINKLGMFTYPTFCTGTEAIFPSPHYRETLKHQLLNKNTDIHMKMELVEVDGPNRIAKFKNLTNEEIVEMEFDLLHATPICVPPAFIKDSGLADDAGFVDVDQGTMQHKKYKNIWSLGDSSNLPTSKTASAVHSQIGFLEKNLLECPENPIHKYKGYTACPVLIGEKELLLCEFLYNGKETNSFKRDNRVPSKFFYYCKTNLFPFMCLTNTNTLVPKVVNKNK